MEVFAYVDFARGAFQILWYYTPAFEYSAPKFQARSKHGVCGAGFTDCGKSIYFVILSEAKNLSSIVSTRKQKKERFFASLRMTKLRVFPRPVQPAEVSPCKAQTPQAEARATETRDYRFAQGRGQC